MQIKDKTPEHGTTLHNQLQDQMQREVYLMRELLSNMHQEEISLMLHDRGSLHQILQQRSSLLEKLSSLRINKLEILSQIEDLPLYLSSSLEISSLHDQVTILSEKVHRQTTTNQRLTSHPEHYSHFTQAPRPKKKMAIATLQIKQ